MKRTLAGWLCLMWISPLLTGCAGAPAVIEADPGQEFLLNLGQEALIKGENLRISFQDVIEDSRCPLNVTCIWEGRASTLVRFTYNDVAYNVVLNEPGLSTGAADTFRDYSIDFHLLPYPGEVENISKDDYQLRLIVTKEESPSLDIENQAGIYAAVIRQLYEVDHTFEEPPNFPVVYIIFNTMDSIGDPDAPKSGSKALTVPLRTAITEKLADLPAEFKWVSSRDEVPLDPDGSVQGRGAIITLGNIHPGENNSVMVSASLYIASLAATGKTYILERQDGIWRVTGDTGVQWIS